MAPRKRGGTSRGYERTDRLGELLREIIAEELDQIDDDRLEMVTVTAVDVDRELDRAKVYFTAISLGDADRGPEVVAALEEHRGRVRRSIGAQARVRRVPEVLFIEDNTQSAALRIESILQSLNVSDETTAPSADSANEDDGPQA